MPITKLRSVIGGPRKFFGTRAKVDGRKKRGQSAFPKPNPTQVMSSGLLGQGIGRRKPNATLSASFADHIGLASSSVTSTESEVASRSSPSMEILATQRSSWET